ncbi:MAG TPA: hypothetical protein VHO47_05310 [Candidatus Babeliales bacterium]|nr:hypothetical protein [Candidatus Babeliales bacterium]
MKKLLLFMLCLPRILNSMEQKEELNTHQTYYGKIIDAASIMQLQPPLPENLQKNIWKWSEKNTVLHGTIPYTKDVALTPASIKNAHNEFKDLLKKYGNMSDWNAALPVEFEGEHYFIKYAGPVNLAYTAMHSQDDNEGKPYGWRQISEFPDSLHPVTTYQTVSQEAGYLRLSEAIEKNKLGNNFFVPETWLVMIRGAQDALPSDDNCIVVQKSALDFEPLLNKKTKEINPKFQNLSNETIRAIFLGIKESSGVLWGIYDNLSVHTQKDQVAQTDTEQPNNEDARNFFNKNDAKRKHNTIAGLEGFAFLCRDALKQNIPVKTQCDYFRELVLKDAEYGANEQLKKAVNYSE